MAELFLRYPEFKSKAVTLSYDDGTVFDREMIDILNHYNIKCTFNLNSGFLGFNNKIRSDEITDLYSEHEVAVHTLNHPHLENLDNAGVVREVLRDRENLEKITGKFINGMAYPFGLKDTKRIPSLVENCGIDYARTTNSTFGFSLPSNYLIWNPTCHHSYEEINRLIDEFLVPNDKINYWRIVPKLFYLWGHSYEFEGKFDKLEDICKCLSNKEEVWYATNGQIVEYIKAFRSLRFSADGNMVYNPTTIMLYGFCGGRNICFEPNSIKKINE